jgi:hypothetical protein
VHGLIFVSLRDFLTVEHGAATEGEIMANEPRYVVSEGYADERFVAIVERACIRTGLSREALLRDFGAFTAAKTFARLYPALFRLSPTARAFLLTVETPIHEVVRVALPNALPPQLKVSEIGEHGLEIVYSSPRRLCAMLRGLVEGTAQVYDESVQVEERTCMEHGGKACTFEVLFA